MQPRDATEEVAAMALAYVQLTDLGRASFNYDYWQNAFAASEREEFREQARTVIRIMKEWA